MKIGEYQKSIIIAGIVCFILIFGVVYVILYIQNLSINWPPSVAPCPDWWKSIGKGKCYNKKNLGTCNNNIMDFNTETFKGSNGLCAKYTWSKNCNLSWDGITYGVVSPC
jgi:hypothetical protein